MTLRNKIRTLVATAVAGMLVLSATWVETERRRLIAEKRYQLEGSIGLAVSILNSYHQRELHGEMSLQEAQRRAAITIGNMRYGDTGYFWIVDRSLNVIVHPMRKEIYKKNLGNLQQLNGRLPVNELVRNLKSTSNGFFEHKWPKPGDTNGPPVAKLTYVDTFVPWNWTVGTGLYLDSVQSAWKTSVTGAALLSVTIVAALILVYRHISRSIFPRLETMMLKMQQASSTHYTDASLATSLHIQPNELRRDELDVLASCFVNMIHKIQIRDAALERSKDTLEQEVQAQTAEIESYLVSIPSILIGLDAAGRINRWNLAAMETFDLDAGKTIGKHLSDCGIEWKVSDLSALVSEWLAANNPIDSDDLPFEKDGKTRFLRLRACRIFSLEEDSLGSILIGSDVTERKVLEDQLQQAQKLESIGQLAAGVAHEINTPTQFITDNTTFLKESWPVVMELLEHCKKISGGESCTSGQADLKFTELWEQADIDYLSKEIPRAIDDSLDGLQRVAKIVLAIKEFSHPGSDEKHAIDINHAVETAITVARNEWKYVATVETHFDPTLPNVRCFAGEFNQVILNLIVNAAQAIGDVVKTTNVPGKIIVSTKQEPSSVLISIEDTGGGIPAHVQPKIFNPFFTTKPVGKGTGQGLALAHSVIVKKHEGSIWFETEPGLGTTFFLRLPITSNPVQ